MARNPMHSVITTLPIIMLLAGLWFYFHSEKREREGALILEDSVVISGTAKGVTAQGSSANSQRIFWIQTEQRSRGVRVTQQQALALKGIARGDLVSVIAAPRVVGSKTLWYCRRVDSVVDVGRTSGNECD